MKEGVIIGGCICFWIVLITGIVLFACSFSILELDEYGIIFDNNKQKIEDDPYTSGRYFTGLGRKFIKFPRKFRTIEFTNSEKSQGDSLSCWTQDGLSIWLDISLHFSLNKEHLREMYFQYGDNWYASLVRIATAVIKDQSTIYTTIQYFQQREKISQAIYDEIEKNFDEYTKGAVQLENLQLRSITYDKEFEQAIVDKLIQNQLEDTTTTLKEVEIQRKSIEKVLKEAENQVKTIYATVQVGVDKDIKLAQAQVFLDQIKSTVTAYKKMFVDLSITGDVTVGTPGELQLIYVNELGYLTDDKIQVIVGLEKPFIK